METTLRGTSAAAALLVAVLLAPAARGAERFHARFEPEESTTAPEGTETPIFVDDFESRGTCNWARDANCTVYYLYFEPGTGSSHHNWPSIVRIRLGASLHFFNNDSESHVVHGSDDANGFPHQSTVPGTLPGEEYVVTPTAIKSYAFECHSHPGAASAATLIVE